MQQVLTGLTVIDVTSVVLGPFATQGLADLGANVVKVEAPTGDVYRAAAPSIHPGMGAGFLAINRNKRFACIDLKHPDGRQALLRLVARADVVVHNMRREAAGRIGLEPEELRVANPRLIYCAAPGYGAGGPYADLPAYDDVAQARIGLADLLAGPDGAPRLAPTIICDKVTGLYLTQAVLAALLMRERTGIAATVEVPMFETMAAFLLAEHLGGHTFDPPVGPPGYNRILSADRRPYRTADGFIVVLPYTTRQWQAILRIAGHEELANSPLVTDPAERGTRVGELYALLAEIMPSRTTADWVQALEAVDVPAAPVSSLEDLIADPHLAAVGFFESMDHPSEGRLRLARQPLQFGDVARSADRPAGPLGAHTVEVLSEAGCTEAEIDRMLESGAIIDAGRPHAADT